VEITYDNPIKGHDSRTVRLNGKPIGFAPLDSNNIRLQRCPKCERENYAPNVMSGICAWCGFDANDHD